MMGIKRQKVKESRYGILIPVGVSIFLIIWLTLAANISRDIQYIFWALVVSFLWAEAMYNRNPGRFSKPRVRRIFFIAAGIIIISFISFLAFIIDNPEFIGEILGNLETGP